MKILHTADWHIGQFKGPVVDGVNLRSQDTVKCLEYMVEVARKERPDVVCISGDIFHQEQIGPVRYSDEMIVATEIITELSKVAKSVIVMRGTPNHDGSGQFRVLEKMLANVANVNVVTKPTVLKTPYADVACIPGFDKQQFRSRFPGLSSEEENLTWTKYISDIVLALRAQCEKTPVLMAHYTVPGCNMESGQTSFFSNFEPVIPRESLQTADYKAVLLGHIHRPQQIDGLHNVFYSGAINAMNFNDEDQRRGFYIHEFVGGEMVSSQFHETPYRRFKTIDWDTDQVRDYIGNRDAYALVANISRDISDTIVRVKYSCTSEQKKLLNIPLLQKDLYDWGAFYVADIEAENMIDVTNRGLLSEESDPRLNLKKWLDEKCIKNPDRIVELAEPIMAEAMKQSTTSEVHGVFKPVSIAVKNYRNYKEERFDFSDISFCTINGVNGAGKSSLFMDAIVDCLYEETREGDNKAWIRGTEDARSGSIEFIFDIGECRFRVVRTRTKSGKPTLNLSQLKEGYAGMESSPDAWLNLSKERMGDTQAEIEKLLGMDCMTFRSCALIMQDQYGLFLQAKKDERMTILGNLLGLGIYGNMEQEARKKLADSKKELASKKEAVKVKDAFIKSKGNPEEELQNTEKEIERIGKQIAALKGEKETAAQWQAQYDQAEYGSSQAMKNLKEADIKYFTAKEEFTQVKEALKECSEKLEKAPEIREQAEFYRKENQRLNELEKEVAVRKNEQSALEDLINEQCRYGNIICTTQTRNREIRAEIAKLSDSIPEDLEEKTAELDRVRKELAEQTELKMQVMDAETKMSQTLTEYDQQIRTIENYIDNSEKRIGEIVQQQNFMENSGCPDIAKASCHFLEKAMKDIKELPEEEGRLKHWQRSLKEMVSDREKAEREAKENIQNIGYSAERMEKLTKTATELTKYEQLKDQAGNVKLTIARLEAEREANDKNIEQCNKELATVNLKALEAKKRLNDLAELVKKYEEGMLGCMRLSCVLEAEAELPVYEERARHLQERAGVLDKATADGQREYESRKELYFAATRLVDKLKESKPLECNEELDKKIVAAEEELSTAQIQKGLLMQQIEDIETLQDEIIILNRALAVAAGKADSYEILKQAFSQDGVPHQIVRNIIPHITDTANNIIGSMTGGTMGVEFVMERTVKGKDGDKATLDVLINEYGKTTLPYASKSGGEKVKASLAVILALSEIKATAAGIQLGMLFIDEPPFLDDDGTQAYVDSLETIRQRYPDVKVMAITHDEAMKARFSQSVAVVKDEDGSHVQWG